MAERRAPPKPIRKKKVGGKAVGKGSAEDTTGALKDDNEYPNKGRPGYRFRSIRAYRRYLEGIMHEAATGRRPMDDVPKAAAGAKAGAEMFITEQMLARHGADAEFEHPLGDDGGRVAEPEHAEDEILEGYSAEGKREVSQSTRGQNPKQTIAYIQKVEDDGNE